MFPTLLETGVDVFVVQVSVTRKIFVIAGLATSRQDFIRKIWKRKMQIFQRGLVAQQAVRNRRRHTNHRNKDSLIGRLVDVCNPKRFSAMSWHSVD